MEWNYSGRIENAYLEETGLRTDAYARIGGNHVMVRNGGGFLHQDSLVRFHSDARRRGRYLITNFISSSVPEGFDGLSPYEFVLFGMWEGDMEKNRLLPTVNEFNRYFNPGDTPFFVYAGERNTYSIHHRVRTRRYDNVSDTALIRTKAGKPEKGPRTIVTESMRRLEELMATTEEVGLEPILMERIG